MSNTRQDEELQQLVLENERLNAIISLWIDCAIFLDPPQKHTAREVFDRARRATFDEKRRRSA
jgi:hypothetical protein